LSRQKQASFRLKLPAVAYRYYNNKYVYILIKNALKLQLTFMRNEIVINIEKINMPPRPYKCNVRLPVLSMSGIDTSVIRTMMAPMPMVANLALSSVKPELVNRFVE